MRCAIFGCSINNQSKNYDKNIHFYSFPKDNIISKLWVIACCRADNFNINTSRICSVHFSEEDYERNLMNELLNISYERGLKLKHSAVPSVLLPKNKNTNTATQSARDERMKKKNTAMMVQEIINESVISMGGGGGDCDGGECSTNNDISEPGASKFRSIGTNNEDIEDIEALKSRIKELENENQLLRKIFTPGQTNKLMKPNNRVLWSVEDISDGISIYSAGPRAYRLLLKKGYPLPAVSTMRGCTKKIKLVPGILKNVVRIIEGTELTNIQKICVLSFDEMKIKSVYAYDRVQDEVMKPYNYVQVIMRGLIANWKQPIYFDYDKPMRKDILLDVIKYVEEAGFYVAAIVSDMGGGNRGLLRDLEIDDAKPWFISPTNDHKVYVFLDVPHLLKLIRNNFVDHGFIVNGKEITKSTLEKVLNLTSNSDLSIAHKISKDSLNVTGVERQKVKLAAKLFSHTISSVVSRCGTLGYLDSEENWMELSEFLKQVNDWFDCLNIRCKYSGTRDRLKAFGLSLDLQSSILKKMSETILNLKVKGKKTAMPFQKGILITNNAIQLLYDDLTSKFDLKYILTYKLNQDVLENFFGLMRSKGGLHDHPNAVEFKYRVRNYILGKNKGSISVGGNVEGDFRPDGPIPNMGEILLSEKCISRLKVDDPIPDDFHYDAIENITGFICHRLERGEPIASSSNLTWVDQLSEGGLRKPPTELVDNVANLEIIFDTFNGDSICVTRNYLATLLNLSKHIVCDEEVKKLFFRSRMYFRIKHLNSNFKNNVKSKQSKIKKVTK